MPFANMIVSQAATTGDGEARDRRREPSRPRVEAKRLSMKLMKAFRPSASSAENQAPAELVTTEPKTAQTGKRASALFKAARKSMYQPQDVPPLPLPVEPRAVKATLPDMHAVPPSESDALGLGIKVRKDVLVRHSTYVPTASASVPVERGYSGHGRERVASRPGSRGSNRSFAPAAAPSSRRSSEATRRAVEHTMRRSSHEATELLRPHLQAKYLASLNEQRRSSAASSIRSDDARKTANRQANRQSSLPNMSSRTSLLVTHAKPPRPVSKSGVYVLRPTVTMATQTPDDWESVKEENRLAELLKGDWLVKSPQNVPSSPAPPMVPPQANSPSIYPPSPSIYSVKSIPVPPVTHNDMPSSFAQKMDFSSYQMTLSPIAQTPLQPHPMLTPTSETTPPLSASSDGRTSPLSSSPSERVSTPTSSRTSVSSYAAIERKAHFQNFEDLTSQEVDFSDGPSWLRPVSTVVIDPRRPSLHLPHLRDEAASTRRGSAPSLAFKPLPLSADDDDDETPRRMSARERAAIRAEKGRSFFLVEAINRRAALKQTEVRPGRDDAGEWEEEESIVDDDESAADEDDRISYFATSPNLRETRSPRGRGHPALDAVLG